MKLLERPFIFLTISVLFHHLPVTIVYFRKFLKLFLTNDHGVEVSLIVTSSWCLARIFDVWYSKCHPTSLNVYVFEAMVFNFALLNISYLHLTAWKYYLITFCI